MQKIFSVITKNKINRFDKTITVEGDKSISHRAFLIASNCRGLSIVENVLESEDVLNTIKSLKMLGVKIKKIKKKYFIYGNGLGSFNLKKRIKINVGNSGTLSRLLFGFLSSYPHKFYVYGDRSMNKRDMSRVIKPLEKIGCFFYPQNKKTLPLTIEGTEMPLAQKHTETLGSAQVKSCILFSALNTAGTTEIEQKKISRDHTEKFLKFVGADIKIKKNKKTNFIFLNGQKDLNSFKCKIPGDLSSAAFFVVLTLLSKNSKLKIKNLNYNYSRLGFVDILKKMNAKIKIINKRKSSNEMICDMIIKSSKLKSINCTAKIAPRTIDEYPILMVAASMARGQTKINGLEELNKKESPRLKLMSLILKKVGIRNNITKSSIKIFGKPDFKSKKSITVNPLMDHRICMTSFVLAQVLDCKIKIKAFNTVNTSFPKFLKIMKKLGAKYEVKKGN